MKVGIVHTAYLYKGGEDIVVEREYRSLKEKQVDVALLEFKNPKSKPGQLWNLLTGIFNVASFNKINKWIDAEKPDVIHLHNWHFKASPSVIIASKRKGIPLVHTLHNFRLLCPSATLLHNNKIFLNSLTSSFPWAAVSKRVYRNSYIQTFLLSFNLWLHRKAGTWKKVDQYIVLTDNAKRLMLSSTIGINEANISVKSNFIEDVQDDRCKRGDHFLFVGRLSEEKGINTLLVAFAKSNLKLVIVGDGPLLKNVKEFEKDYPNITYAGFLHKEDIIRELKNCAALIFSSIWYEGNPLTIIEAFASATPIIASKLGAMKTMITHEYNGLHFNPGDAVDLIAKAKHWEALPASEKMLFYNNARSTYVEKYSANNNISHLLAIYKSVIHGKD